MNNQSETIGELAKALAEVQSKLRPAKMDAENPFFHSKYATLESCWNACRELLSSNGLAVVQSPASDGNGRIVVRSTLVHISGEWIAGTVSLKPVKDDPQAAGSAISYGRRYGLCCLVGIVSGENEDDGNAATQTKKQPPPPRGENLRGKQPPKSPPKDPQKKADEESSPIVQLWIKADKASVPQEEWKLWCKEHAITKDRRTQGKKKMEILERKINEWKANSRDDKLFVSDDECAWLRSTAEASDVDIQGEDGLLKFCQAAINNFELKDLKTLTKDEFDACMKELNERSAEGSHE